MKSRSLDVRADVPIERARAFLGTDLPWNIFVLQDLAAPYAEHARLPVALDGDGQIVASCLIFGYPGDRSLVPFGSAEGIRAIMTTVNLPEKAYLVAREQDWAVVREFFEPIGPLRSMHRMSLACDQFAPAAMDPEFALGRLEAGDHGHVDALYQLEAGFTTSLFPDGQFFGARDGVGRLCAVAVATAANDGSGFGTIGGVFTDPGLRGRGLGKAVTSGACQHWFDLGRNVIYLNVHSENIAARSAYRALGFSDRLRYLVSPVRHRRRVINP